MTIVNKDKGGRSDKKSGQHYFAWVKTLKKTEAVVNTKGIAIKHKATSAIREAAKKHRSKKQKVKKTTSSHHEGLGAFATLIYLRIQPLLVLMMAFGQLPFCYYQRRSSINFKFSFWLPVFWISAIVCCCNWLILIWLIYGMSITSSVSTKKMELTDTSNVGEFEDCLSKRFWLGYWIVLFIFFHVAVSSTEFVCRARSIARFLKDLFQAIEEMKMDLTVDINFLIISNLIYLSLGLLVLWYVFTLRHIFPWVFAICYILMKTLLRPMYSDDCDSKLFDENCVGKNHEKMAPFGLILMMYAIVASRLYTIYFMVICKIFRNVFYISTKRMEICLQLDSKKESDEEEARVDFESMLADYYSISGMVHNFNVVNGYSAATYFFIQMLGFLSECFALATHSGLDEDKAYIEAQICTSVIPHEKRLVYKGLMLYAHLAFTFLSCVYVSSTASQVYTRILEYSATLYRRGIVGFRQPEERDFVRTMWMNCSHRHPVLISPARLFPITPQFMVDFVGVTIIYLIMIFPIPVYEKQVALEQKEKHEAKLLCCAEQ